MQKYEGLSQKWEKNLGLLYQEAGVNFLESKFQEMLRVEVITEDDACIARDIRVSWVWVGRSRGVIEGAVVPLWDLLSGVGLHRAIALDMEDQDYIPEIEIPLPPTSPPN